MANRSTEGKRKKGIDLIFIAQMLFVLLLFLSLFLLWPWVKALTSSQIIGIASAMATITGALSGFSMACISILISSSASRSLKASSNTGFLDKLINALALSLLMWLLTALSFLLSIYAPQPTETSGFSYANVIVQISNGFLISSGYVFYIVWNKFKQFMQVVGK
ncbi:hypothetical protein [Vibrio lentus]|uniref:hypothetical protein n=1 Tax=Vibrio lentus TaxID=136468 RepID=UPI00406444CE